jgi:hypothetical protein
MATLVKAFVLALVAGCANEDEWVVATVPAPAPLIVQNVSYATTIVSEPAETAQAPAQPVQPARLTSGFATCDAYFDETERCARSITPNAAAIERLEKTLDAARASDRVVAASGSAEAKADVSDRCVAALRAYDYAACIARM